MRHSAASPLPDHAFEPGEFFVRKARCPLFKFVDETLDPLLRYIFTDMEITSFNAYTSARILAMVSSGVGGNEL